jgi:hypothetical protein
VLQTGAARRISKARDEEHAGRSPTTSTGLPVEDQVRKEWDPRKGGLPTFLPHGMTNISRLRKRPPEASVPTNIGAAGEIDIVVRATIAYSSEKPDHPVEHLLDGNSDPGATWWIMDDY